MRSLTHTASNGGTARLFESVVRAADGKTPIRRARELVGLALLGVMVSGVAFGGHPNVELIQIGGGFSAVLAARMANII